VVDRSGVIRLLAFDSGKAKWRSKCLGSRARTGSRFLRGQQIGEPAVYRALLRASQPGRDLGARPQVSRIYPSQQSTAPTIRIVRRKAFVPVGDQPAGLCHPHEFGQGTAGLDA